MSACQRFEREGLRQLERGTRLDDHFRSCPDCRAAWAAHSRLRRRIADLGGGVEPPAGWQRRVWARIAQGERRPSRRGWLRLGLPAGLAAAAALLLFAVVRPGPGPSPASLQVSIEAGGGEPRRGAEGHPGDRLVVRAVTGGAPHAELRIYRHDSDLVTLCSSRPPCRREGDEILLDLPLESIGSYQTLLLLADRPLPKPSSGLDADAGAALDAGARVLLGRDVQIR